MSSIFVIKIDHIIFDVVYPYFIFVYCFINKCIQLICILGFARVIKCIWSNCSVYNQIVILQLPFIHDGSSY